MNDFLSDKSFLLKVNQYKVRQYQAAIMILDFETENPIARFEGKVVSGNMNIAANTPVRKTCSLTVVFDDTTKNITDINNLISINKKISLSIGFNNPFYHLPQYQQYGETLWFKQGVFFITKASSSISATGAATVKVELMDKMAALNGTVGGVLPASTSFHDRIIIDANGDQTTEYPLIVDIIKECVHHFGGEHFSRISVEDVPDVGRIVVSYTGSTPLNLQTGESAQNCGRSFVIAAPPVAGFDEVYVKGDNVGYMETPLTYPGELIMKAGSTVTSILDAIKDTLGNYEYFYDEEGIFHFRQIPNFQATGKTPLNFVSSGTKEVTDSAGNVSIQSVDYDSELQNLYFPKFTDDQFINEFADASLVTSVSFNPNYSNIKNDFICWGTKNSDDKTQSMVRYHLAIDTRPKDIRKPLDLEPTDPNYKKEEEYRALIGDTYSLCHKSIWSIRDKNTNVITRYAVHLDTIITNNDEDWGEEVAPVLDETFADLPESYWFNWREELYRQALLAYGSSTDGSYYDEELLAEWRNIYDPKSTFVRDGAESFKTRWEDHYGEGNQENPWGGYNVDVKVAPEKLRYWLDIIDTSADIGKFGVNRIGRRTKVEENSKINEVFEADIPDIVYIPNDGNLTQMQENIAYYISIGQTYAFINSDQMSYFQQKNSFGTCYEQVRAMLYNNLIYNASVSLTTIPVFYLDVNKVVRLNFPELGIVGDFVINSIGWNIGGANTMSLSLNEAIVVV